MKGLGVSGCVSFAKNVSNILFFSFCRNGFLKPLDFRILLEMELVSKLFQVLGFSKNVTNVLFFFVGMAFLDLGPLDSFVFLLKGKF